MGRVSRTKDDWRQDEPGPDARWRPGEVSVAAAPAQDDRGPAKALQGLLAERVANPAERRWSPRKTLGFVVLTCGGFWLATGLVLRALL
jgi:hypothetical protein